ncbi:unnamed protein product [Rhizopus stolonifer]
MKKNWSLLTTSFQKYGTIRICLLIRALHNLTNGAQREILSSLHSNQNEKKRDDLDERVSVRSLYVMKDKHIIEVLNDIAGNLPKNSRKNYYAHNKNLED